VELKDTPFEFRHRFWIFMGIFFAAFFLYAVDHVNSIQFLVQKLAHHGSRISGDELARILFLVSAALVFLGGAIRMWGTSYLKTAVMGDKRVHSDRLLADGPFRCVRNPLYLGNIIAGAGIGLLASRLGFLVLVFGLLIFCLRLISHEEKELSATQGESYRAYCKAVPRFIPSLWPRVPSAGNQPHWLDGFLGEFWWFSLGVAGVALAFTFQSPHPMRVYYAVAIGFGILGWVLRRALLPPAKPAPAGNSTS
jgi:protein-S-isoprenylcysteine O-methyltransferase Ste14